MITGRNFVILSTQDWDAMPTRKHRWARWWARQGNRVLYVEQQMHWAGWLIDLRRQFGRAFRWLGDPQFPKERIEVFAGGGVAVIDDFRAVEFSGLPGKNAKGSQNKGHRELLANFVAACEGKTTLGVTAYDGLIATLCAEAIKSGRSQAI